MSLLRTLLASFLLFTSLNAKFIPGFKPSFYSLNMHEKRELFIAKLSKLFDKAFVQVDAELAFVRWYFKLASKHFFKNDENFQRLLKIRSKYRIKELYDLYEYELKIQRIPKSLGIAQAIVESATGTSRFAREANNLFGEWTWDGEGLIPKNRDKNKFHRIRVFDTLQASVDSYVLNLNRHAAYRDFRKARERFLENGEFISGLEALRYLHAYSELGKIYMRIVKKVIISEDLERFDLPPLKRQGEFIKAYNLNFKVIKP